MKSFVIALLILLPFSNLSAQSKKNCSKKLVSGEIFTNEVELKEWLTKYEKDTVFLLNCLKEHALDSALTERIPTAI